MKESLWRSVRIGAGGVALFHRPSDPVPFGIGKPDIPWAVGIGLSVLRITQARGKLSSEAVDNVDGRPPPAPT